MVMPMRRAPSATRAGSYMQAFRHFLPHFSSQTLEEYKTSKNGIYKNSTQT